MHPAGHGSVKRAVTGVSGKAILLVEDDPNQVLLALRAFKKSGITEEVEVVVRHSGEEALEYLFETASKEGSAMPEFVLLDVQLPKMSGMEVLKRLRCEERTELLPVVLYSSSGKHGDVVEGYRSGANSYVTKPNDFESFSRAMRALGWYWLEWNQVP
jgi:two-component system response regulator